MLISIKKRLLELSATFLNYFSVYCLDYKKLISDVTYRKLFNSK